MKKVSLLGANVDLGAGRRGVDMGPSAIRYAGLRERLLKLGLDVQDAGNVPAPLAEQLPEPAPGEKLRYFDPLHEFFQNVARKVSAIVEQDRFPIIMGGDHSIALGTINGSALAGSSAPRSLGVLWIDAHGDFNTPESTPSGNIHGMPLAALAGLGDPRLVRLLGKCPVVDARHIVLVGVRDLDPGEKVLLRESGAHVFTMHDIDRRGMADVMMEAIHLAGQAKDGIHVSFDMDVLDPTEVPGVGTPVPGGISYREAHLAMELIHASGRIASLDCVEVNPILDTNNLTARIAVELISSAMGEQIY